MLLCVPLFFSSLIRRIHNVRAIEQERARFSALNECVARPQRLPRQGQPRAALPPARHRLRARRPVDAARPPGADADDELIGRIRRSSLLLNTHLRDMLTLAKGEAGRLEMRPEPFDACALVESVAASAADLASDKKLELIVDVPPSRDVRRRRRRAHRPDPHQPGDQLDPLHRGGPGPARPRAATTRRRACFASPSPTPAPAFRRRCCRRC